MNKEEIDKWLDENEGMSYTKLEELHDWLADERYKKGKEIERLNNIINELENWLNIQQNISSPEQIINDIFDKIKELKEKSD